MNGVFPDVTARFTPEAKVRFDEYLGQTRAALAGHSEVSPDEIEQDLRAHIAAEFPPGSGWVRLDQLEGVLARLGRPEQWVSDGGRSSWRKGLDWVRARPAAVRRGVQDAAARLREGPDDWRLAYLTTGILLVGVIIFPLIVVCLPLSYILARAAVSMARSRGTALGPQKWLVYPPLVLVSVPLLVGFLVWPAGVGAAIGDEMWRHHRAEIREAVGLNRDLSEFVTYSYCIVGALSLWNTLVGISFWMFPKVPAAVFSPFFSGAHRGPWGMLAAVAGCVFVGWFSLGRQHLPVNEWATEVRRGLTEDRPEREQPPRRAEPSRTSLAGNELTPEFLEQRARKLTLDFLRACRNQDVNGAARLAGVPFFKGLGTGTVLAPDNDPVLRDTAALQRYLDGQVRQVRANRSGADDVARVRSYADYKPDAGETAAGILDLILAPTDFVVSVTRDGKDLGLVFVKVEGGQIRVVGLGR